MKKSILIVVVFLTAAGCSFYNFFEYEENTGLHVIERPGDYKNAKFGIEIAPTGTPDLDLMAVSAGRNNPTIIYRLAEKGDLVDVSDPWRKYLDDRDEIVEVKAKGTGASLVGLPTWGSGLSGCVAIGEPDAKQVVIDCELGDNKREGITLEDEDEFGHQLAAIRPLEGESWLLAAAAKYNVWVYSDHYGSNQNRTEPFYARKAADSDKRAGDVYELAAGRAQDRFYVAITTFNSEEGKYQLYIFVQSAQHSKFMEQVACIERRDESGFGGIITTGDLNDDGYDELIVSQALIENRVDSVHVYDINSIIPPVGEAPLESTCTGDSIEPLATLRPSQGDLDVTCKQGCNFGAALAVGDIATDDEGPELIVGAPDATVDGKKEAGAVYIYHGKSVYEGKTELAGQISDSMPERGYRFGGGLAVAPIAGRNELLVSAIGKGHVFIAFCTGVGEDIDKGGDITTNAAGSVISTRCRP
ncbi:MAG: hypothetical protein GY847_22990 [Proteobacteria bacterium]|nr:hypothetical protein [Pseudomonadota bacterium]